MSIRKNVPNFLTSLRIVIALIIPFIKPLGVTFFVLYSIAGATDILDGFIARKLNLTSGFGAKLDSVADLLFYTISLLKMLPVLVEKLPSFIWIIVALILSLRIISYLVAAIKYRRFSAHHTWLNKATGAFVFAVPYFLASPACVVYCFSVCFVGIVSTSEELIMHLTCAEYDDNVKSILAKNK